MKNTIYFVLLLAMYTVAGCKTDGDADNLQELEQLAPTYRIKESTLTNTSNNHTTVTSYTYNADGNVLKEDHQGYYLDFVYFGNKGYALLSTDGDTLGEYFMNNAGYADTVILPGNSVMVRSYNSEGNLITMIHQGGTINYSWSGGNVINTGVDYFADKFSTINYINKGYSYMGNESKNLPKAGYIGAAYGNISYEFDNLQRVIKRSTGNFEESFTYY